MAELIVADARVLIAWLDERDAHHHQAIEVLAGVSTFVVHPLTLAEVLVHPVRVGREKGVVARLETIGMEVATDPLDAIVLARMCVEFGVKMPDSVVLATAHGRHVPVATFDAALRRAADQAFDAGG